MFHFLRQTAWKGTEMKVTSKLPRCLFFGDENSKKNVMVSTGYQFDSTHLKNII